MALDFREFCGRIKPVCTPNGLVLVHSAKGSSWEDHKYIKRVDGTYYYPNNYEGGRHIDSAPDDKSDIEKKLHAELSKSGNAIDSAKYDFGSILNKAGINISDMSKEEIDKLQRKIVGELEKDKGESSKINLDSDDVEKLANEVIRGNFGNGQTRKDLLGENYEEVQKRVNELVKKSSVGSKKVTGKEPKNDKVVKALEKIGSMGYNVSDIAEKYKKK